MKFQIIGYYWKLNKYFVLLKKIRVMLVTYEVIVTVVDIKVELGAFIK